MSHRRLHCLFRLLLRLWGMPDWPSRWVELLPVGVDLIKTDDLQAFLLAEAQETKP